MRSQRGLFIIVAMACLLQAQGADKYTDENRPYEFGFKIDGEQHRHEKKDENGLIMGEFGFITADGVYHVTVYATDENGNFKILSMKNIRVKPYPTGPERQGHSLSFPAAQKPPQTQKPIAQTPPRTQGPIAQTPPQTQGSIAQKSPADVSISSVAAPARSCSHCSLPTTTTRKPILTDIAVVSKDQSNPDLGFPPQNIPSSNYSQGGSAQNYPQQGDRQSNGGNAPNYPQPGTEYNQNDGAPQYQQTGPGAGERNPKQFTDYPQGTAGSQFGQPGQQGVQGSFGQSGPQRAQGGFGQPGQQGAQGSFGQSGPQRAQGGFGQPGQQGVQGSFGQSGPQGAQGGFGQPGQQGVQGSFGQSGPQGAQGGFGQPGPQGSQGNPSGNSQFGPKGEQGPSKPTLISAQMQIVDKNTDIFHKNPGEQDGLPDGINKGDMQQLLYTFNYTVGFHGHFEEGYTNGAKQGYYFVTGRNGIRTRVDYVADEKGFRPKITQEVLDLLSEKVPKPETEKEEKYGLKGYEFKWLYYPLKSNSR